jgi:hypothetical protein
MSYSFQKNYDFLLSQGLKKKDIAAALGESDRFIRYIRKGKRKSKVLEKDIEKLVKARLNHKTVEKKAEERKYKFSAKKVEIGEWHYHKVFGVDQRIYHYPLSPIPLSQFSEEPLKEKIYKALKKIKEPYFKFQVQLVGAFGKDSKHLGYRGSKNIERTFAKTTFLNKDDIINFENVMKEINASIKSPVLRVARGKKSRKKIEAMRRFYITGFDIILTKLQNA